MTCNCTAYNFPHRPGSGQCQVSTKDAIDWPTFKQAQTLADAWGAIGRPVADLQDLAQQLKKNPHLTPGQYFNQSVWDFASWTD